MASGYYDPNSSPPSHHDSSALYAGIAVVGVALVFILLKARHWHRLNKEAQEAEAAGLHRAAPPSGGGETTVGRGPRQQQPPAPAPLAPARLTTVEMAMRPSSVEPIVCTYRRADGWAEATCAVCLAELDDGVTVRVLPVCMHYFHGSCVGEWLLVHHSCPLCRAPLDPPAVAGAPE